MDGFQRAQWYFNFSMPQNCFICAYVGGGGGRIGELVKMQVLRLYQQILI